MKIILCWMLLFALIRPVCAQEKIFSQAEKIDSAIQTAIAKQEIVGIGAAVIDKGHIVWIKGYGYADREAKISVYPQSTHFRWASVSKPLTAIAAMQLVEQGKLDLDANIRKYVPEFPEKGQVITARQLLCHQGGIVHYSNGLIIKTPRTYDVPHPFESVINSLDFFKESPLVNNPGDRFAYSTHGYILLSAVVERAGNQSFASQVSERIGRPLNMRSLQPDYDWIDLPERAVGYIKTRPSH